MNFLKLPKFLCTATNHHGVHSPFVYDYLTKCIYQKSIYRNSKTLDILIKSILYFEYQNLEINDNSTLVELISTKFPESSFAKFNIDLIYFEDLKSNQVSNMITAMKVHNDSMILINNIHKNKSSSELWNKIIEQKIVSVSIDFFYCGALFFRKEQVKEHFKVRT